MMNAHQKNRDANAIDRNISGMVAAVSPIQDRPSIRGSFHAQVTVGVADRSSICRRTSSERPGEAVLGWCVAAAAAASPDWSDAQIQGVAADPATARQFAGPTDAQKDIDAYGKTYAASKGYDPDPSKWTPDQQKDVAAVKANAQAGSLGGTDFEQRQWLAEKQNGVTTDDYATWKAKHAAAAAAMADQSKAAQDFKDTARTEYTATNSKLTTIQPYIETLTKDPEAAQEALKSFQPTTGKWGALDPFVPQKVKDAAIALQKVQASLTAEGLSGVKNVRNAREFNTLGLAATAGLNAASSPDDFKRALNDLKNKYLDTQATSGGGRS